MIYYANLAIGMNHRTEQRSYGRICFLIHEPYTTGQGGKKQQKMRKCTFYLAISKKSRTFAPAFRKKFCLIWRIGEKLHGKLSEWSKEPHSKCGIRITSYRGFESLTFRKKEIILSKSTNCFKLYTELKQFSFLTTGN